MSDVQEVLEQIREHYLSGYHSVVTEFAENHENSAPEILLQLPNKEELPFPYQLYRIDMGSGDTSPPKLIEFNHDSHLNFSAIEFEANSIKATLNPISWNAVEFESDAFAPSNEQLSVWAIKWIDPEETGKAGKFGFGGYLHSITFPEEINGKMHFSVDFGSASIECFYELFSVFIDLGVKNLKIHSNSVLNEN